MVKFYLSLGFTILLSHQCSRDETFIYTWCPFLQFVITPQDELWEWSLELAGCWGTTSTPCCSHVASPSSKKKSALWQWRGFLVIHKGAWEGECSGCLSTLYVKGASTRTHPPMHWLQVTGNPCDSHSAGFLPTGCRSSTRTAGRWECCSTSCQIQNFHSTIQPEGKGSLLNNGSGNP